jgi:hypothetical protein
MKIPKNEGLPIRRSKSRLAPLFGETLLGRVGTVVAAVKENDDLWQLKFV